VKEKVATSPQSVATFVYAWGGRNELEVRKDQEFSLKPVEASSLYNHPEKREFFSEEVKKLGREPAKTTTFEWLEIDDRVSHAQKAA